MEFTTCLRAAFSSNPTLESDRRGDQKARFYGTSTLYGQRDNIQYTLRTGSGITLDRSHTRHRSQPSTHSEAGWTAAYALG
jgi:hypothetical protein